MAITHTSARAFVPGTTYATRSIGDHDCIYRVRVIRRTARSVWAEIRGETVRRAIRVWDGVECFDPFGRYSMSPTITADRLCATAHPVPPAPQPAPRPRPAVLPAPTHASPPRHH